MMDLKVPIDNHSFCRLLGNQHRDLQFAVKWCFLEEIIAIVKFISC